MSAPLFDPRAHDAPVLALVRGPLLNPKRLTLAERVRGMRWRRRRVSAEAVETGTANGDANMTASDEQAATTAETDGGEGGQRSAPCDAGGGGEVGGTLASAAGAGGGDDGAAGAPDGRDA